MRDTILVIDCVEPKDIGFYLDEEPSMSGEGKDIIIRPLGTNPFAKSIIKGVPNNGIATIDSSKTGGKFSLMLILTHGKENEKPILLGAISNFDSSLLINYNKQADNMKADRRIIATQQQDMKLGISEVAQNILTISKKIRGSGRDGMRRGDDE